MIPSNKAGGSRRRDLSADGKVRSKKKNEAWNEASLKKRKGRGSETELGKVLSALKLVVLSG